MVANKADGRPCCSAAGRPSLKFICMGKYHIYILSNVYNTTLYVGVTDNLRRRIEEHRSADAKSFTSRYNCHKLVYTEEFSSIAEAIDREKQIKSWSRRRKDELIDRVNPHRVDLMLD